MFLRGVGAGAATLLGGVDVAAAAAVASEGAGATGGAPATSPATSAASAAALPPERRLRLVNAHTDEMLDTVYFARGTYVDGSLARIDHVMRDHRADEACSMDPRLLDDLVRLHASLDTEEPLRLLSGYRTPRTNARLRERSKGVAKFSLHMEGRAADIHVPGIGTRALQRAALAMRAGGVGYYASSGFVHIDTGRVRHWERA